MSFHKFLPMLKFLKHHVKKTAFLTEYMSAVIEQKTPPKYKDPGCPTVSSIIGNHEIRQSLLDLGASVKIMPYAIYLSLGLGEMKPTSVSLQLVDLSTIIPRCVVEDVLVQIDKFYYPVDFLILDLKEDINVNSKIPIILGRPFLVTANALINCRNGLMKLSFGNMTLEVNIFHVTKQVEEDDACDQTYVIDALTQEVADDMFLGPPQELELDELDEVVDEHASTPDFEFFPSNPTHVRDGGGGTIPMVMSNEFGALQGNLRSAWLDAG